MSFMTNFRAEDMPGKKPAKSEVTKTEESAPAAPKKPAPKKAPAKSETKAAPVAEDPKKADTTAAPKENTNE